MTIFKYGHFKGASGTFLDWKINCDDLLEDDWECIVKVVGPVLEPFGEVLGVPRGGVYLARKLRRYLTTGPPLIVDDVWTTGYSMTKYVNGYNFPEWKGFVVFARGDLPEHVTCLFKLRLGE